MGFPRAVVDLGGTNLRVARFESPDDEPFVEASPLEDWETPDHWLEHLTDQWEDPDECAWVLGVPGTVDRDGRIGTTPNLPEPWSGNRFPEALRNRGWEVHSVNDANLAALGEYHQGAGAEFDPVLTCTLGTGLGGGYVEDGSLVTGFHGYASEIGHVTLHPSGRSCGCGDTGCAETYVSATGLEKTFAQLSDESVTARKIVQSEDNPLAAEAVESFAHDLGHHLANLLNVLDPQAVVLAGGLGKGLPIYREPMEQSLNEHLFSSSDRSHTVRQAELDQPALWGGKHYNP